MTKALPQCSMAEGLRSLVGANGWDYCILWKLSSDHRFLEWMGCCCSGAGAPNGSKDSCRDVMFQHPRTRACDALSDLPSSIPLDSSSGERAKVLLANQPTWNTDSLPDYTGSQITATPKTEVLVPIQGGLVELFVTKHVAVDRLTLDFVMSRCNSGTFDQLQPMSMDGHDDLGNHPPPPSAADNHHPWMPLPPSLPWDPFDGSTAESFLSGRTPPLLDCAADIGASDMAAYQQPALLAAAHSLHHAAAGESSVTREAAAGGGYSQREDGRGEQSGSEGSLVDDEDDQKSFGRNGKRHHSKNLVAERKRRKKLNDRLYQLRALVPKITKMDRASILGDAIEYVKELVKQVKDLQDELELEEGASPPDDDEAKQIGSSSCKVEAPNPSGTDLLHDSPNSSRPFTVTNTKLMAADPDSLSNDDKAQQMEPQVEVTQLAGNEFFLKVCCEYKKGGFARLMEAISSLGLEVTNANVTTFLTLVLNVFRVEKRDNEAVQVEQVRDSLLELTRHPSGAWPEPGLALGSSGGGEYGHHHPRHTGRRQHNHSLGSHHQMHYPI